MKLILIILLVIAIILAIYLVFYFVKNIYSFKNQNILSEGKICFDKNCFSVEIAKTPIERTRGLMHRDYLAKGKGMLFIFEREGIYPFWMKDTLIPLDIIWLDSNNRVVFIAQNIQPCKGPICPSVNPSTPALRVLEVNAGMVAEIGLQVGDLAEVSI